MLLWTRQNTRHWCSGVYDIRMLTMFTINFPPRLDIVLMLFIIANTMCCHGMGHVPHLDPGELVRVRIVQNSGMGVVMAY